MNLLGVDLEDFATSEETHEEIIFMVGGQCSWEDLSNLTVLSHVHKNLH